ncbi:MAG: hypothetical protein WD226_04135, partial [Planctomycetota bacterium]
MWTSRSIQALGCLTQATLFQACLTNADLAQLECWVDRPSPRGFSPAVWCRASLHRACQQDDAVARRVTDRLDLQFFDTVVLVRGMDAWELERLARFPHQDSIGFVVGRCPAEASRLK